MDRNAGAAGLAALAICESLLLSLTESKVLPPGEARAILEDAAAANRNAIPLAPDGGHHEAAAAVIKRVMATAAEPAIKLDVPLDVEVGWGAHWGEAH